MPKVVLIMTVAALHGIASVQMTSLMLEPARLVKFSILAGF